MKNKITRLLIKIILFINGYKFNARSGITGHDLYKQKGSTAFCGLDFAMSRVLEATRKPRPIVTLKKDATPQLATQETKTKNRNKK